MGVDKCNHLGVAQAPTWVVLVSNNFNTCTFDVASIMIIDFDNTHSNQWPNFLRQA